MVELFVVRTFHANRRTCRVRSLGSPQANSPRQPTLNEPYETCTRRSAQGRIRPEPRGGIFTPSIATARPKADLSRSPGFDILYGIEPKDYSTRELLFGASLEPAEPLSWRIRLYGPLTRRLIRPPPLLGW
jgi:hypothetical protein